MGREVKNPYSYGSRNNSLSYSSFSHRIPRFEYRAPPGAITVRIEGTKCGDYPFDRRGPTPEPVFDALLELDPILCFTTEEDGEIFFESYLSARVSPDSEEDALSMSITQQWSFASGLVLEQVEVTDGAVVQSSPTSFTFTVELGDRTIEDGNFVLYVKMKVNQVETAEGDYTIAVTGWADASNADITTPEEGVDSCEHFFEACPVETEYLESFNTYDDGDIEVMDQQCEDGHVIGLWTDLNQEGFNSYEDGPLSEFADDEFAVWGGVVGQQPPLPFYRSAEWLFPANVATLKVLVVGGGGGGAGGNSGAGGGAGRVVYQEYPIGNGPGEFNIQEGDRFEVSIGEGGRGGLGRSGDSNFPDNDGLNGEASVFRHLEAGELISITAPGGGGTGANVGKNGGSGGGGRNANGGTPVAGTGNLDASGINAGHAGGQGISGSGGGGGAGEPGKATTDNGNGGDGLFFDDFAFMTGFGFPQGWVGGGGGRAGCTQPSPLSCVPCGIGGKGGGGSGQSDGWCAGQSAAPNTGGGGGGAKSPLSPGGKGGSGIIVIAWDEIE